MSDSDFEFGRITEARHARRAWDLSKVPTDALMRQLARRFL